MLPSGEQQVFQGVVTGLGDPLFDNPFHIAGRRQLEADGDVVRPVRHVGYVVDPVGGIEAEALRGYAPPEIEGCSTPDWS